MTFFAFPKARQSIERHGKNPKVVHTGATNVATEREAFLSDSESRSHSESDLFSESDCESDSESSVHGF